MKSAQQILDKAIELITRLAHRKHSTMESMNLVTRINNRYQENIRLYFGTSHDARLSDEQMNTQLPASVYALDRKLFRSDDSWD